MADNFLRLVQRTAKFDRKKYGDQLSFFNSKPALHTDAAPAPHKVVDFFGNAKTTSTAQPEQGKEEEEENEGVKEEEEGGEAEGSDEEGGEQDSSDEEHESNHHLHHNGFDSNNSSSSDSDIALFHPSVHASASSSSATPSDASSSSSDLASRIRQLQSLRKAHGIHVLGSDCPDPITRFSDLETQYQVPPYLIRNLVQPPIATASSSDGSTSGSSLDSGTGCGYTDPTPIQMQAIPILLRGRELLACAPTGSGKTAAFVVPILTLLRHPGKGGHGYRAIVLSPTRELAEQTHRQFVRCARGRRFRMHVLTKANAAGEAELQAAGHGQGKVKRDVLITTPMRLVHLLEQAHMDLSRVEVVVCDEADRLLEDNTGGSRSGFLAQVDTILAACTHPRLQRALFSATMSPAVEELARTLLHDPLRLTIGARNASQSSSLIHQSLVFVGNEEGKLIALRQMIATGLSIPMLVFVQSKERAQQLYTELAYDSINVDTIHADRSAAQRSSVLKRFRAGNVWVLICTDLMARGMDFVGVKTVLNYDFPQSTASYIHRIGRTGRAGREGGRAVTLFTEQDKPLLRSIATVMRHAGCEVAEWMMGMDKIGGKKGKRLAEYAPPRQAIVAKVKKEEGEGKKKKEKSKKGKERSKRKAEEGEGEGGGEERGEVRREQDEEEAGSAPPNKKAKRCLGTSVKSTSSSTSSGGSSTSNGSTGSSTKKGSNSTSKRSSSSPSNGTTAIRSSLGPKKNKHM